MRDQDSFKQLSTLHVGVMVLQPHARSVLKRLGWVRLATQLSPDAGRSFRATLQQPTAKLETPFKDLYQKGQRPGSCNLCLSDLLQVIRAGRNPNAS